MRRRHGFTIVELLVAMALILFMMAILSQAFVSATGTFRSLKASGDMAEKLRATTGLLTRDLAADHFEGKKRLSDTNFWLNGPPEQGFFRIWQGSAGIREGNDLDGIGSYLSTTHALAFTIKVRGNQMGDFLTAGGAGGILLGNLGTPNSPFGPNEARYLLPTGAPYYSYQWGEVAWFLQPQINPATGQQDTTVTDPNTGSAPVGLYTLYRRQRLAVPDNSLVPTQTVVSLPQPQVLELSCWPNGANWYFNNPNDLTVPARRFGMVPGNPAGMPNVALYPPVGYPYLAQQGATGTLAGSDIQLTDVVSFDIRILPVRLGNIGAALADPFVTLWQSPYSVLNTTPGGINNGNPAFFPVNPTGPMVFDTWSSINDSLGNYSQWNVKGTATSIPLWNGTSGPIIYAIQISIRIWDSKTNQTRQVTMIQAM